MYQMNCECEQGFHSAALERAEIGEGMLEKIPEMLGEYKRIYLVADENTVWRAPGWKNCWRRREPSPILM